MASSASSSGTRTVLAPLTTTFTPPSQCSTYGASGGLSSTETYWQGQSCIDGFPQDASSCWPPALVTSLSGALGLHGIYSPGLHCPDGYTSACTAAKSANGNNSPFQIGTSFSFQFSLTAGETAIGCCPLGLTCALVAGGIQTCQTVVTSTKIPQIGFCRNNTSTYYTAQSIDVGIAYTPRGDNATTITLATASLYGPLVQIVFKSTDIPSLASPTTVSPTAQPAAGTSGAYAGGASGNDTNVPSTDNNSSSGLSTGAKIGIGVGVPLAVLLLAAIGAFIFFRKRGRARGQHGPSVLPPTNSAAGAGPRISEKTQAQHQGLGAQQPGHYLTANYPGDQQGQQFAQSGQSTEQKWRNIYEAPSDGMVRGELDSRPVSGGRGVEGRVELPGDGRVGR